MEELINNLDKTVMRQHFEARRALKTTGRTTKTELVKKMKGLTPKQIAEIEKILAKSS